MIAGLFIGAAGLLFLFWLTLSLAVYALPFYAGLSAAFLVYHHDAGMLGMLIVGVVTGASVLFIGQFLFAVLQRSWLRALVAAVYTVPAGIAGWSLVHGLFRIAGAGEAWLAAFSWTGAIIIAGMAWARMSALRPEVRVVQALGMQIGQRAHPDAWARSESPHRPERLPIGAKDRDFR